MILTGGDGVGLQGLVGVGGHMLDDLDRRQGWVAVTGEARIPLVSQSIV